MKLIPICVSKASDQVKNKVKATWSLSASWRHILRDVTPLFLNSVLDRGLLLASCPGRFIPSGKVPGIPEISGYVEHETGLYCVEDRKTSGPYKERNQDPSDVQPVVWSLYYLSYTGSKGDTV